MIKKLLFLLTILILGLYYLNHSDRLSSENLADNQESEIEQQEFTSELEEENNVQEVQISNIGLEKIKEQLSKDVISDEVFKYIHQFSLDSKTFLEKTALSKAQLRGHIKKGVPDILKCLPTLCGAKETPDGLLQETNTYAHQLLERYFELVLDNYSEDEAVSFFTTETLEPLLSIENSKLQSLTLDLLKPRLLDGTISPNGMIKKLNGESMTKYLSILQSQNSSKETANNIISKIINQNDINKIVLLSEGLMDLQLTEKELADFAEETCPLKHPVQTKNSFKMVKYNFNKKATSMNTSIDWNHICPD